MARDILYGKASQEKIISGVNKLSDIVKLTLGPLGRNVLLDKGFGSPLITNDGVSIAREIELEDSFENMGAKLLYEVANNTNDNAGDGTTTAIVLAQEMINNGKIFLNAGYNPVVMRKGINYACDLVSKELLKQSKIIKTSLDASQVATISSGSNEVGNLIKDALDKVGFDGVITVDESRSVETTLEIVKGIEYNKGYTSSYLVTDREKMTCEFENCYVLVTDQKINNMQQILPVLQQISESHKPFLIIADDIDNDVQSALIINKLRGAFNYVSTKAPDYGQTQINTLEDISLLTGATFASKDLMYDLSKLTIDDLGICQKVTVTKDSTIIVCNTLTQEVINTKVNELKKQYENSTSEYDKKNIQKRISRYLGGVATIKVGATTETEMREKKLRIEDSLNATKAAISEGVVIGGGCALINCYKKLNKTIYKKSFSDSFNAGIKIVIESLVKPFKQILLNSGCEDIDSYFENQLKFRQNYGFDAETLKKVDLFKKGIIDPTKVTRNALINACSITSMILISDASVCKKKENTPKVDELE